MSYLSQTEDFLILTPRDQRMNERVDLVPIPQIYFGRDALLPKVGSGQCHNETRETTGMLIPGRS